MRETLRIDLLCIAGGQEDLPICTGLFGAYTTAMYQMRFRSDLIPVLHVRAKFIHLFDALSETEYSYCESV